MAAARKGGKTKDSAGGGANRKTAARSTAWAAAAESKQNVQEARGKKEQPHPAEWVVGAIAVLLILSVLGYLGFRGLWTEERPANFDMKVEAVEPVGELFHVTIAVTNSGDQTAARVVVEATQGEGPGAERGEFELDYVPAGSTRRGSYIFSQDPSAGAGIRLSVLGYTDP